jgi:hypothetical protein
MHRADMLYDVRTLQYRLLRKEYTDADLQAQLATLPDDAAESVETTTRFIPSGAAPLNDGDDSDED